MTSRLLALVNLGVVRGAARHDAALDMIERPMNAGPGA